MHPHSRSYDIYSSLRNARLPSISGYSETIHYNGSMGERGQSKSNQNSSSLILYDYETSLKKQVQREQMKEHIKKEKKRHRTLEAEYVQQTKSKQAQSVLSEELQAIKLNLRSLSMLKESEIRKKQKMIQMKSHTDNHYTRPLNMPPQYPPYYSPVPPQNPYDPYSNPYNQYNYSSLHQNYGPYNHFSNPYSPVKSNYYSHQSIADSPKSSPYKNLSKKMTPSQITPRSKLNLINQQSRYSNPSQTQDAINDKPKRPKSKKDFNRTQFKKRLNHMEKYNIRQNAVKKMLRCFWSVYFCVCIKKQALKIVQERKKFFIMFWPEEFIKFFDTFKDYFYSNFFPFFKLLKEKQFTTLIAEQEDSKPVKAEKKKTFKELLKIFFTLLKQIKQIENLGKAAWGFCSNGSFVEKGVLTKNELEYVCLNENRGTLLMDDNLQKSQIITFVLIKMVLFKFVLNVDKKWPNQFGKEKNIILNENLKLIASVIYDLMIQAQESYLNQVDPDFYPLNNYPRIKASNKSLNLELSPPLMFETTTAEKGEIISGLHSQQFIQEKLKLKKTEEYVETIKEVVETLHVVMKDYDDKFRAKVRKRERKKIEYKY